MSLWDQVKANMLDWYSVAADKTEEMARIGVRRYDKFGISREIERELTQLGNHVYTALKAGRDVLAVDPVVRSAIERIQDLERQLAAKDQEIEAIRTEHRGRVVTRARADGRAEKATSGPRADTPTAAAGAPAAPVAPATGGPEGEDEHAREAEPMVTAWSEQGPAWDGTASDWVADPDEEETLRDDWQRRPGPSS